jgi:hypothetical protein
MAAKYPAIPDPKLDLASVRDSVLALKQAFEIHSHQRSSPLVAAVTWQDLVTLGLITTAQVPTK